MQLYRMRLNLNNTSESSNQFKERQGLKKSDHRVNIQSLGVNKGQYCPRVAALAASPYQPNSPMTQLSPRPRQRLGYELGLGLGRDMVMNYGGNLAINSTQ